MRRRDFLGGMTAAATWPAMVYAQSSERMRRIGVLMNLDANDAEGQARLAAFMQGLQEAGWSIGRNVRVDVRWGVGDPERYRIYAAELIGLAPEVIVTAGGSAVSALQRATRTIPIVFANVTDPVGSGLVASLARPGGNTTGVTQFEYGMSAKWLELLKEIAPDISRVAVLRAAAFPTGIGQFAAIQAVASSFRVELTAVDVNEGQEIEQAVIEFAKRPKGGLIVTSNPLTTLHRETIIKVAMRYRLPAIYPQRYYVTGGGLISYGANLIDQYRLMGTYVDRILKGEKPTDLPVQAPVKYELAINLKTAKALGLTVAPALLVRANEVIE